MKLIKTAFLGSVIVATVVSCQKENMFGVKGKGNIVSAERNIDGFDKIDLNIDADLEFVQDSVYYLEIQAQSNIIANIDTDVESDGELEIDFDDWVRSHKKIKIIVHAPTIYRLEVSGSGSIKAGSIQTSDIDLHISGSGDIELHSLVATTLESSISGSGNMEIGGGSVDSQDIEVSGSGKVNAASLTTQNADVDVSGSGDIELNCSSSLNVRISGSGTVYYSGNPVISVEISGSGDLIHQ
ncbi:MAG: head GIN domain-containing protein [Bacteroidota bacterium]